MDAYSLPPQLDLSSSRHFARVVESVAGVLAACACLDQFRIEGVVELAGEHLAFVFGECHLFGGR